jgi:hypothetical protein
VVEVDRLVALTGLATADDPQRAGWEQRHPGRQVDLAQQRLAGHEGARRVGGRLDEFGHAPRGPGLVLDGDAEREVGQRPVEQRCGPAVAAPVLGEHQVAEPG